MGSKRLVGDKVAEDPIEVGPVPAISHLHFLVLATLADGHRSGRWMRQALTDKQVVRTGPAFYQMMAKLEKDDLVEGWYVTRIIDDYPVKERHYQLTSRGIREWRRSFDFYASHHDQRVLIDQQSRTEDPHKELCSDVADVAVQEEGESAESLTIMC